MNEQELEKQIRIIEKKMPAIRKFLQPTKTDEMQRWVHHIVYAHVPEYHFAAANWRADKRDEYIGSWGNKTNRLEFFVQKKRSSEIKNTLGQPQLFYGEKVRMRTLIREEYNWMTDRKIKKYSAWVGIEDKEGKITHSEIFYPNQLYW